jgi:hypothetical protein
MKKVREFKIGGSHGVSGDYYAGKIYNDFVRYVSKRQAAAARDQLKALGGDDGYANLGGLVVGEPLALRVDPRLKDRVRQRRVEVAQEPLEVWGEDLHPRALDGGSPEVRPERLRAARVRAPLGGVPHLPDARPARPARPARAERRRG